MVFFKRLILFLVIVVVIVLSIVISGLNTEKVLLDLYYFKFEWSLGFLIILSLSLGLIVGLLLALFSFYLPLKSEIRQLSRKNREITQKNSELKKVDHSND